MNFNVGFYAGKNPLTNASVLIYNIAVLLYETKKERVDEKINGYQGIIRKIGTL